MKLVKYGVVYSFLVSSKFIELPYLLAWFVHYGEDAMSESSRLSKKLFSLAVHFHLMLSYLIFSSINQIRFYDIKEFGDNNIVRSTISQRFIK